MICTRDAGAPTRLRHLADPVSRLCAAVPPAAHRPALEHEYAKGTLAYLAAWDVAEPNSTALRAAVGIAPFDSSNKS